MSKTHQTSAIKAKVIFGFSLVFMAFVAAAYFSYISFNKLLDAVEVIAQPDQKLMQIDSILVAVTQTDNTLQEYTVSKTDENLKEYYRQIGLLDRQIQQLKQDVNYKEGKLDSVLNLMNAKLVSFDEFLKIKEQKDNFDFYKRAIRELETQVRKKERAKIDSTDSAANQVNLEEAEEQKNFIQRFFSRKEKLTETTKDSLRIREEAVSNLDAEAVRKILVSVKNKQAANQRRLDRQELDFLINNSGVMNNIYELVRQIKQEQQADSGQRSALAKQTLEQSLARIGIILALVLISTAVIIYLIFADITRSDYYKRKLQTAKLEAERLARVKEDFLANMSHEIRTPLTAILGFAKQLQHTHMDTRQEEFLNAIDHSSEHLLSLVNDILDFSKIEAGELKFEKTAFDLVQVVRQVQTDLLPPADKKNLSLTTITRGEELRFVWGDAFRLKQVLYNLIYNAIKFTEQGSISVKCLMVPFDKKRIKVQINVEDTGVGISPEQMKKIFAAFNQTDASNARKYGGTGLGLSISKRLIEAQGGRIEADSQLGQGSVFTVLLLFEKANQQAVQQTVQAPPEPASFAGHKLLVIDDDVLNTRLVEVIVEKWGIQATVVHTGAEGIQRFGQEDFDLVLCDLQMPEMDGETVVQRLKLIEAHKPKKTPFVAFTARILKEDWARYQQAGMDDYLLKPFDEAAMHGLLSKYLIPRPVSATMPDHSTETAKTIAPAVDAAAVDTAPSVAFTLNNIRKFTGDDEEALAQYLESFLSVNASNLEYLQESLVKEDLQQASFYAHKMMPGIQQLEAKQLTDDLRKLELLSSIQPMWDRQTAQLIQHVTAQAQSLMKQVRKSLAALSQKTL